MCLDLVFRMLADILVPDFPFCYSWIRLEQRFACFLHCREVCFSSFCFPGSFNFISPNISLIIMNPLNVFVV